MLAENWEKLIKMRWDDVKLFSVTINPKCLFTVNQRRNYETEEL
jgi:hypothetical protein